MGAIFIGYIVGYLISKDNSKTVRRFCQILYPVMYGLLYYAYTSICGIPFLGDDDDYDDWKYRRDLSLFEHFCFAIHLIVVILFGFLGYKVCEYLKEKEVDAEKSNIQ